MSLYHNPREMRLVPPKGRKKSPVSEDESPERYSCELCSDEEYDSETELYVHKKERHLFQINRMLMNNKVCKTCIKRQDSYEHLIKHIKTQHLLSSEDSKYVEREIYICDICNLLYFNKDMLAVHIVYTHSHGRKTKLSVACPKCGKNVRIKNLWFHFQRHLMQSVACCPICLKKCTNRKELNAHVQKHAYYYRCNICQYDASNKSYFAKHMEAHTVNPETYVEVYEDVLKRCFVPRVNTKRSEFTAGLRGLRLYELEICILCRAISTSRRSSADHIMKCHMKLRAPEKKKPHACLCGQSFFNKVLLKHHVFKLKGDHKACEIKDENKCDVVKEKPEQGMDKTFVANEALPFTDMDNVSESVS